MKHGFFLEYKKNLLNKDISYVIIRKDMEEKENE